MKWDIEHAAMQALRLENERLKAELSGCKATEEQGDGLPLKYTDKDLDDVVERCAQVAEQAAPFSENVRLAVAAIRALKDKP